MERGARGKAADGQARSFPVAGAPGPRVRRMRRSLFSGLDLYLHLLTMRWSSFFGLLSLYYIIFNLIFAWFYMLVGDGIGNARPGSFTDAFFFSIQTMATIGYGQMYPQSFSVNLLVCLEVLLGMSGLALATGLIFARFSRPTARVLFSRIAVIAPYDGVPTLMFRAANQRHNQILEAQVSVSLLRDERSAEGTAMRRFHDVALTRSRTPAFALSWMMMHRIDETSPLFRATPQTLAAEKAEIVVTLIGLDATFAQTVHARYSYVADDLVWNRRFADILKVDEDGRRVVDFRRFHDLAGSGE